MTNQEIRQKLLLAGVKNLTEFGYQSVNTESILTDEVYQMFFRSMLSLVFGRDIKMTDLPKMNAIGRQMACNGSAMRSAGLRGTHYQTTQSLRARQDARI